MKTLKIATITLAALAAAVQVGAAEAPKTQATDLRAAQRRLAWQASGTKGMPRQELLLEQQRLERLINDLEAGRSVDPAEIDRGLKAR